MDYDRASAFFYEEAKTDKTFLESMAKYCGSLMNATLKSGPHGGCKLEFTVGGFPFFYP